MGIKDILRVGRQSEKDLMWVPVHGADTEVWAARSRDGKREYNIRQEWTHDDPPVQLWMALWANTSDMNPNVFAHKFISRWDAQNTCEELEKGFDIDEKEVEEEQKRLKSLNKDGWAFQGVYSGMSVWTRMINPEVCYVIINDRVTLPNHYSLSIRSWTEPKGYHGIRRLMGTSLGVFDTLSAAQNFQKQLEDKRTN